MGCRTRVIGNNYDKSREIVNGRGNLSFTSINLPRIAIKANHDVGAFFAELDEKLELVIDQLKARYKIQANKKVRNYPFLMGQGIWLDSDKLGPDDTVGEVLKHGSLTVGFIGLAECLKALTGKHHGESEESQRLGLAIITRMRERMDLESSKTGMNFTVIATPAEGLSGRFVRLDRQRYGKIEGVTDRDYYTNSFHVPVYYPISAFRKIQLEAPYHNLTNGGHISYVELDGDPSQNLEAFETIVRYMKETGIGYGSINHPVDRDPVCGYTGIIGEVCPRCGRREGEGVSVEKLRQLGVYKNYNSTTIGYHGDPAEERDRQPNCICSTNDT
jgi:ribonucleoside-triphosphate reductase